MQAEEDGGRKPGKAGQVGGACKTVAVRSTGMRSEMQAREVEREQRSYSTVWYALKTGVVKTRS